VVPSLYDAEVLLLLQKQNRTGLVVQNYSAGALPVESVAWRDDSKAKLGLWRNVYSDLVTEGFRRLVP